MDYLRKGADDFLTAPIIMDELILVAKNLIHLSQVNQNKRNQNAQALLFDSRIKAGKKLEERKSSLIAQLQSIIEENYKNSEFTVNDIYSNLGLSKSKLHRMLAAANLNSPGYYLREKRLAAAHQMLLENELMNISEMAYSCGFGTPNYFSAAFYARFGCYPSELRK